MLGSHGNCCCCRRCLPDAVVQLCIRLAAQHSMTLTAYCGDRIFCKEIDEHTNRCVWVWVLWGQQPASRGLSGVVGFQAAQHSIAQHGVAITVVRLLAQEAAIPRPSKCKKSQQGYSTSVLSCWFLPTHVYLAPLHDPTQQYGCATMCNHCCVDPLIRECSTNQAVGQIKPTCLYNLSAVQAVVVQGAHP